MNSKKASIRGEPFDSVSHRDLIPRRDVVVLSTMRDLILMLVLMKEDDKFNKQKDR